MRLWSIHPCYLDAKGLVALWREALLAQKVLQGTTRGYRQHPQLTRFRSTDDPVGAMARFLRAVAAEADARRYRFDRGKIIDVRFDGMIPVTEGQLRYEFAHLLKKLASRDPSRHEKIRGTTSIRTHPLFFPVQGEIEEWEVV